MRTCPPVRDGAEFDARSEAINRRAVSHAVRMEPLVFEGVQVLRRVPIRLGSKDARPVVASTSPTTRVHRGAGRIICRRSIAVCRFSFCCDRDGCRKRMYMNCQVRARPVFRRNCFGVVGPKAQGLALIFHLRALGLGIRPAISGSVLCRGRAVRQDALLSYGRRFWCAVCVPGDALGSDRRTQQLPAAMINSFAAHASSA